MKFERCSGILLHPTSLPGDFGIGTLGREARVWVDFLQKSGQKLWQILPLGPTGFGNSPYQCYSAFAGNPLMIDLDTLVQKGWLEEEELGTATPFTWYKVEFDAVSAHKMPLLQKAYERFKQVASKEEIPGWKRFLKDCSFWLEGYALFKALHDYFDGKSWLEWDKGLVNRKKKALSKYETLLEDQIGFQRFLQFVFYEQWMELKAYANERGVKIVGDIPIYVSGDGADVWMNPELFLLDEALTPTCVAGVPPDYFSETGQRWGNPLFDWDAMEKSGFSWWLERIKANLKLYDYVRIDHFRGFEAYWSIPADEETAVNGEWVKAPGNALFETIRKTLGEIPVIAEDLGIITPEVEALRDAFELPGMRILQFAFDGNMLNPYLPHNIIRNSIVYTGTHDNNTVVGWFYGDEADGSVKDRAMEYLNAKEQTLHWDFIRAALGSVADVAIMPLQDLFGYGGDTRMNTPGTVSGNWAWRFGTDMLQEERAQKLAHMTHLYGR